MRIASLLALVGLLFLGCRDATQPVVDGQPPPPSLDVDYDDEGPEEVHVCPGDDDAFETIQAALTAVAPGGTVEVCEGTYDEALVIDKGVTLRADDDGPVILAPTFNPTNAIEVGATDPVVIRGLVIDCECGRGIWEWAA